MIRGHQVIGGIATARREPTPFDEEQVALIKAFADQAVIAIENARLLNELRQRTDDLSESLEQQTATSEVLKVISGTGGELQLVFQTILENATRICEAKFGTLYRSEGDAVRCVAMHGAPKAFSEERRRVPVIRPAPMTALGRALSTKRPVQIADVRKYPDAPSGYTVGTLAKLAGARTLLAVPMLTDVELVGAIIIYRQEVRPFTDKQVELVANFAKQAVIAIENTRLLNELRQRTDDLTESLEQQTATSEVLKVISSSPGELEPVFQAMLENARRICEAKFGALYRCEGDALRAVAMHGAPQAFVEERRRNPLIRPPPQTTLARAIATKQPVQIADIVNEPHYFDVPSGYSTVLLTKLSGARTVLTVPMLKENEPIGAIVIYRTEVRPFSEKQIELVQNFAAQAVIAIENTRLLNELRESLQQQTATADVLKVISSSPGELKPVFDTMLGNAMRICEAQFGNLFLYDGEGFTPAAWHNVTQGFIDFYGVGPHRAGPKTGLGRVASKKEIVHIEDITTEQAYVEGDPLRIATVELLKARTYLAVPMLKDEQLVGAIVIYRQEVRPFAEKQIELVKSFAAQAVIAIENTRLLSDLNKLNQQLEQRVTHQVSEIERMSKLRRFLPPQVADLIVASGTEKQLESHRREITALFCDLRGFTGFSESSDPEDVMALLREYHAAIGEIINTYGGTLERYAGDGVMVVFNDPMPVDNPALQAVLMGIEMRAAIGELIEKWRKLGHDIGFGIGIAHGFATLGTIGFEGRFDYAAIGTVSNVASRLCDEAKPGQILISPRVLMAVEKDITVEPVGDFALKGIRRPLTAYNVLAAKAAN
jgi:GAF domain-containing protein